jgi:quercetin dioxygenase-like cupin family protein
MAGKFLHLEPGEKHDLAPYFAGPWSTIERKTISPSESVSLTQTDREVATYVIKGTGQLEVNGRSFELIPGSAAMLLKDSTVNLRAEKQLELLPVCVLTPLSQSSENLAVARRSHP